MPNTDITLTRTLSAVSYSYLELAVNRRWTYEIEILDPEWTEPAESEILDPEWVESEETPEQSMIPNPLAVQPMITNPITNQQHVLNMIAVQYMVPLIKTEMTIEVAAELGLNVKQAAIDNIKL